MFSGHLLLPVCCCNLSAFFCRKPVAVDDFVNGVESFAKDSGLLFNEEFEVLIEDKLSTF